jgi:hypothetical protein
MNKDKDLKTQSDEIIRLKEELKRVTKKASILEQDVFKLIAAEESKEKDEMIDALIDELEGTTKTDYTFWLIGQARELIFLKHRK